MVVIHYCYQTLTCSNYFRSCLLNFVYQHFGRDGSVKPLFRENIVDIAQEAKGSGHPLPVMKHIILVEVILKVVK